MLLLLCRLCMSNFFFFSDISHKSTEIEFLKYILLINSIQSEVNKNIAIDIYCYTCYLYSFNIKKFKTFLYLCIKVRYENSHFLNQFPLRFGLNSEIINYYL